MIHDIRVLGPINPGTGECFKFLTNLEPRSRRSEASGVIPGNAKARFLPLVSPLPIAKKLENTLLGQGTGRF